MKPRIFFHNGWWRVTLHPKNSDIKLWNQAHQFVAKLNNNRPKRAAREIYLKPPL